MSGILRRRRLISRSSKPVSIEQDEDIEEQDDVESEDLEEVKPSPKSISKKPVMTDFEDDDEEEEEEEEEEVRPVASRKPIPRRPVEEDEEEDEEEVVVKRPSKRSSDVADEHPALKKFQRKLKSEEEEEEEEEDLLKNVKTGRVPHKPSPALVEDAEDEEDSKPAKILKKTGVNPVADLLELMESGKALIIKKESDSIWTVTLSTQESVVSMIASGKRLEGRKYYKEVINPEYREFMDEWKQMTYAEKKSKAKKLGVTWNAHPNPKVDVMRLTQVVIQHMGIEKYKPEYKSRSARSKLRG